MVFSSILGLAGSAIGAIGSGKRARRAERENRRQFDAQLRMQNRMLELSREAQRDQREENAHNRQIEQLNRILASDHRDYHLGLVEDYNAQLSLERQEQIDRQLAHDREAARLQQERLERLLANKELRADERSFAIQQLEQARSIANGERDEDLARYHQERATQAQERDFAIEQFYNARDTFMAEREDDLALRDQLLSRIGGMQGAVEQAARDLGYIPEIPQLSENDIAAEITRRQADYQADVDRAADRVASVNEADLIRSGLDESSTGIARRADVAARLAGEYQDARQRAYDDALSYVTGRTDAFAGNVEDIISRRAALLSEAGSVAGAGIDELSSLPGLSSAAGAYSLASSLPTANLIRNVRSANDFDAPVQVGSALYDDIDPGSTLAAYVNPSSAASNIGFNVSTGIYQPHNLQLSDPGALANSASNIGSGLLGATSANSASARERSRTASDAFGARLTEVANNIDWGNIFGGKKDDAPKPASGTITI